MPSAQFLGRLAFFLFLMGLGSALAGWPTFMLGRSGTKQARVVALVFAGGVVGTLHNVVPMSAVTSMLANVTSIAIIGTAFVRKLCRD